MSRGLCGACGEWFDDATPCKCGEYWQRVRIDPKTRALSVAPVVTATIRLADDPRKIECPFCGKSWIGFKYNADDPCKASDSQVSTLREQIKVLREALEDSCETIQSHLNTMPTYTQDGWGIERFDFEGEYLGFEQVNPDYVIQGFHELVLEILEGSRAALEHAKPKDGK